MSTTITPTAEHDGATLTRAVAGERTMMDGGSAPLATILQKLTNRAEFAKEAVRSTRPSWSEQLSIAPGGSSATFNLSVGAISRAVLYDGSKYVALSANATTIGSGAIEGGGVLSANTWYYVYIFNNAGSVSYEISTTAPAANGVTKNGDATRIYLGCFPTLSTGAPVPFRKVGGRVVYDVGGSALADMAVITSGAATVYTSVPCSGRVPPHARIVTLDVRGTLPLAAGAITSAIEVQSYGSTGALSHILYNGTGAALEPRGATFDVVVDSSHRAQYKVNGGANAPTADIYVVGFYE